MERDLRYKVEHVGDSLIGMFKKLIGPSKTSSEGEATGNERDLRYTVEHIGDSFAGLVKKASDSAKASAKGVVLTYDIRQAVRKKERLTCAIGARVVEISREDPSFSQDGKTVNLLTQIDMTEKKLGALLDERQKLLDPTKSGCCSSKATTEPVIEASTAEMVPTA